LATTWSLASCDNAILPSIPKFLKRTIWAKGHPYAQYYEVTHNVATPEKHCPYKQLTSVPFIIFVQIVVGFCWKS